MKAFISGFLEKLAKEYGDNHKEKQKNSPVLYVGTQKKVIDNKLMPGNEGKFWATPYIEYARAYANAPKGKSEMKATDSSWEIKYPPGKLNEGYIYLIKNPELYAPEYGIEYTSKDPLAALVKFYSRSQEKSK